jgi:CheY-like chemotaxis protein
MQGVDGGEVIRFIRRDPLLASVPILAVSSDTQDAIVAGILSAGANAFLPKPVEYDELETTVARITHR